MRKMRRRGLCPRLIAIIVVPLLLLLAGCGGGDGKEAGGGGAVGPATGDSATASGAYEACREEINRFVSAGGFLSQVVGRNVDAKGLSASWDFIVLGPEKDGTTLKEHHITWNKGKVDSSAVYECDTLGYENSPSYSYLFNPVGEKWLDSPGIAEDYVKRYPETKSSLGTMEMRLKYYRDPSRGLEGTFWEVVREAEQRGMAHAIFRADSGDFAGETKAQ